MNLRFPAPETNALPLDQLIHDLIFLLVTCEVWLHLIVSENLSRIFGFKPSTAESIYFANSATELGEFEARLELRRFDTILSQVFKLSLQQSFLNIEIRNTVLLMRYVNS